MLDAPSTIDELDTPSLIVDLEAFERNVGERVMLIPSHIDTTVNLHDVLYAHRSGRIEAVWPVAARGRVQ